jgi:hypothetical protein
LPTPSNPWPEGIDYPPEQLPEGWITSIDICKRFAPLTKKRNNLFAIPLNKLKVKIKLQEATDSFKNY